MTYQQSDIQSSALGFPSLTKGTFVQRDNRFRVQVLVENQLVEAHLPNSGRLSELLVKGAEVWLTPAAHAKRRTRYDLSLVKYRNRLASVDARLPNHLVNQALHCRALGADLAAYPVIRREVRLGSSRIDFMLEGKDLQPFWIEIKSVTLVNEGTARFPDAPTTRGVRHVQELESAVRKGDRAAVVFVIQREDASRFEPNRAADPRFADALHQAAMIGVKLLALRCRINIESAQILDKVPITLS